MEYSFSSWIEDTIVLEFSDDEYDRMGQTEHFGDKEQIRRDSKRRYSSQVMHDFAKVQLENHCDFKDLKLDDTQESEYSALPKHSPEKPQTTTTTIENDGTINVPKLIYQLLNAKVVIEKMCESSKRDLTSETKCVLPKGLQLKDSIQRYCPKCKTLKTDKNKVKVKKFCSKCEAVLKYVCFKCNTKQYLHYNNLRTHWNKCGQTNCTGKRLNPSNFIVEQPSTDASKKLNRSDFLVKKANIGYSRETIRYCSRCDKIEVNCSKRKDDKCRNCNHYLLYQCNKCKAQFNKFRGLKYHMQRKCYPSRYKCNQCDFTNPLWDTTRRHVENVHYRSEVNCPRCNIVMKNENSLQTHLKFCGKASQFRCDHCAFKTKYNRSLQCHMKFAHEECGTKDYL